MCVLLYHKSTGKDGDIHGQRNQQFSKVLPDPEEDCRQGERRQVFHFQAWPVGTGYRMDDYSYQVSDLYADGFDPVIDEIEYRRET